MVLAEIQTTVEYVQPGNEGHSDQTRALFTCLGDLAHDLVDFSIPVRVDFDRVSMGSGSSSIFPLRPEIFLGISSFRQDVCTETSPFVQVWNRVDQ